MSDFDKTFREIDMEKVETLEDMKKVIAAMRISFSKDHPSYPSIERFLKPGECIQICAR